MAEAKTKATKASVAGFLKRATEGERRADSKTLVDMMTEATGAPAVMWGTAIVGFGTYESQYADGRTADWPVIGFAPQRHLTLYIGRSAKGLDALLGKLGKHKMSGGCLHIKRLGDVDLTVLRKLIVASVAATNAK